MKAINKCRPVYRFSDHTENDSFIFITCVFEFCVHLLLFFVVFVFTNKHCNNHNVVIFKLWKKERLISQVVMKNERHMDTPPFLEP